MDKKKKQPFKSILSKEEEVYVQELVKGVSQRQAYIKAWPKKTKRWKGSTIDVKAHVLWKLDKIQNRYYELKERLVSEAEEEFIIDAKEVLREYKKIAFSNITDYMKYSTKDEVGHNGKKIKVSEIELKDSEEIDGSVIQEISLSEKGTLNFKMHNKMKALDKLADYLGLFDKGDKEKSTVIISDDLPDDEGEDDE